MKPMLALAPALLLNGAQFTPPRLTSIFEPERLFTGEVLPNTTDQIVLTIAAHARDDMYPAYSLALAYLCTLPSPDAKQMTCGHTVRMLRVVRIGQHPGPSIGLYNKLGKARSQAEVIAILDRARIEWLEADFWKCEGAGPAFDAIRRAKWNPDLHYTMNSGDGSVVIHPGVITVTMTGDEIQARHRGYVFHPEVPAAAQKLVETLEPCWKPAKSPPPWRRRVTR